MIWILFVLYGWTMRDKCADSFTAACVSYHVTDCVVYAEFPQS